MKRAVGRGACLMDTHIFLTRHGGRGKWKKQLLTLLPNRKIETNQLYFLDEVQLSLTATKAGEATATPTTTFVFFFPFGASR